MTIESGEEGRTPRRNRVFSTGVLILAAFGLVFVGGVVGGLALDITSIDPTSGGYDPPYTDYDGEPIDWDNETYVTSNGMVGTGYVVDVYIDCTTGKISFEVAGIASVEYRTLSDRAIAIHEPREACIERGFDPEF